MSVEPEIPPEVLARMNAKIALSQMAAEETGQPYNDKPLEAIKPPKKGISVTKTGKIRKKPGRKPKGEVPSVEEQVEEYQEVSEPLKGMTKEQVEEVRGRNYPDAPKMDAMLGDWTPAFERWLWKMHPKDASIRYYARINA